MKYGMLILLACVLSPLTACARDEHQRVGDLVVSVPWARETPPNAPVAGGFLTVQNKGRTDDRLMSVESLAAARVEIHEVREDGGVARMHQVQGGLPIAAGKTVVLKPGGYHLMFIRPTERWVAGDKVKTTLIFQNAGRVEVLFDVRSLTGQAASHDQSHH